MPLTHQFGATNEPDTCLWCGAKLKHITDPIYETEHIPEQTYEADERPRNLDMEIKVPARTWQKEVGRKNRYDKPGWEGNGYFCTLHCGGR